MENNGPMKDELKDGHIAVRKDDTKVAGHLFHNNHNPDVTTKVNLKYFYIAIKFANILLLFWIECIFLETNTFNIAGKKFKIKP